MDAVSCRGDVPVVEQHSPALVGRDPDVGLPRQLGELGLLAADDSLGKLAMSGNAALGLVLQKVPSSFLENVLVFSADGRRTAARVEPGVTAWTQNIL